MNWVGEFQSLFEIFEVLATSSHNCIDDSVISTEFSCLGFNCINVNFADDLPHDQIIIESGVERVDDFYQFRLRLDKSCILDVIQW